MSSLRRSTGGLVAALALHDFAAGEPPSTERDALFAEAVYTGELWRNQRGGRRRGTRYLDNLDLTLTWHLPQAGTLFGYVLYNNGAMLSESLIGDYQTVSNIDAPEALRLYELWYERPLAADLDVRFGLYDLNAEFDVIEASRLFINSSHGIGPDFSQSGVNGPSIFPVTSLALRTQWQVSDRVLARAALLDAVPGDPDDATRTTIRLGEGALGVLELDARPLDALRIAAGAWRYSRRAAHLDPTAARVRDDGAYILAEGAVGNLQVFGRFGIAQARSNPVDRYIGAGFVYTGLIPGRPRDQLGLAYARASAGQPFRNLQQMAGEPAEEHETVWELTYAFEVAPWLVLQPDLQYVVNPSWNPALDDALVIGLRFQLSAAR
ncbi:carbohydrate porin [soil metagenome]